jgi:hypothetical protein
MTEPLYYVRVEAPDRRILVQITGTRETVLDVALRVVLDNAESLQGSSNFFFTVYCGVQK